VPTHIGVRSANRSASIRISGAPVFSQAVVPVRGSRVPGKRQSTGRPARGRRRRQSRRTACGSGADKRAVVPPHRCRCHVRRAPGRARQCRQRPAHGVAVDAIGLGDFGLARQPIARAKRPSAMPRSIPSATCRQSATPEAVSCRLMVSKGREKPSEKSSFVTKQSWRFVIKLSNIIDNLISARLI